MGRDSRQFAADPAGFMQHVLFQIRPGEHVLYVPQHSFVTDADGSMLADHVGRVEEMQQVYDTICRRIGLPDATLDKVNGSSWSRLTATSAGRMYG